MSAVLFGENNNLSRGTIVTHNSLTISYQAACLFLPGRTRAALEPFPKRNIKASTPLLLLFFFFFLSTHRYSSLQQQQTTQLQHWHLMDA